MNTEKTKPSLYWRFLADVLESNEMEIRWSYLSLRPGKPAHTAKSPFLVKLIDNEGSVIATFQASVALPKDGGRKSIVSGAVPFHPATARIVIAQGDIALVSVDVPQQKPKVKLRATAVEPRGVQTVEWELEVANRERSSSSVFFESDDGRRYPIVNHVRTTSIEIDMDALPGCDAGRIIVRVSDGVWTSEATTNPFRLPNKVPLVWITRPRPGEAVRADQPLQLEGRGWEVQAQRPLPGKSLEWFLDGKVIGAGRLWVVDRIMTGEHSIILRATDSNGLQALREVRFFGRRHNDTLDKGTSSPHLH